MTFGLYGGIQYGRLEIKTSTRSISKFLIAFWPAER
jgi:hypothetical protein